MGGFLFAVWVAACAPLFAQTAVIAVPAAPPGGNKVLWILEANGRLSAYDTADFRMRMASIWHLPPAVHAHPENVLSIGRSELAVYRGADGQPHVWKMRLGSEIAYMLSVTSKAGQPIRLADQEKANPYELSQVQATLLKLPMVEDVAVDGLQKSRWSLANAALIGWLDAHRLLVWKDGQLFLVDTTNEQLTATRLKAERAADVFLE